MTDVTENTEPESVTAAAQDQTSVAETFENTLQISQERKRLPGSVKNFLDMNVDLHQQDVGPTACVAPEETDSEEKLEKNRQRDRQVDRQTDGPPVAESCSSGSKWGVGAECQVVWSEDGHLYPATVVSVDGGRCRVRFHGYNNEEEVELSALRSPDAPLQTQTPDLQDWKAGSRCRAVYSEDGLVYPAVVLWVKGQRCRVRFDDYNNEEEQDVSCLLNPDQLHGPSRAAAAKGSWRSSVGSSNSDWRRRRREESQGERGAERRSAWRDDACVSEQVKEKLSNPSKVEKEAEERKRCAEKPTNHSFSFFPPFPPPPQSSSGDSGPFIPAPPPPPPLWIFGGKESGGSVAVDATSSMLMLWYMCGFHTGSYLAQQEFKSSCKH